MDDSAADEDAAFESVIGVVADFPGNGCDEAIGGCGGAQAGVLQEEASGAVSVFGEAGSGAALAEERGLLISGDAGEGDSVEAGDGCDFTVNFARAADFRKQGCGDAKKREDLLIPAAGADVEQHGARSVGRIGDVQAAGGELPDEPGVDGAEGEAARIGEPAGVRNVVEDPGDFAGGKIGVDDEAGASLNQTFVALRFELIAEAGGAAILPDDGVADGPASGAVPDDGSLALVGDADGGDVFGLEIGVGQGFESNRDLRGGDFFGVVFDPSGLGKDLRELALG